MYEGWFDGPRDIWLYDIASGETENLIDHPSPQFEPSFDGQWVVWADGRNDSSREPYWDRVNPDIYGVNLETREVEPLCTEGSIQTLPNVHSGFVVWEDFRHAEDPHDFTAPEANTEIYLLELATRREVRVTNLPGRVYSPRVIGRRVFFVAPDDTGMDAIFMVDLDEAGVLEPEPEPGA